MLNLSRKRPAIAAVALVADLLCPWCYVAHHQLSEAVKVFLNQNPTADLIYKHVPYSVYPQPLPTHLRGKLVVEYVEETFNFPRNALTSLESNASLKAATQLGLTLNPQRKIWDSRLAHCILQRIARQDWKRGLEAGAELYKAFFEKCSNIGDPAILKSLLPADADVETFEDVRWSLISEGVPHLYITSVTGKKHSLRGGEEIEKSKILALLSDS